MDWLLSEPMLFVVDGHSVIGLVSPSDLNKQPGRLYVYLRVAELEVALAELLRRRFADEDETIARLPAKRQGKVRGRLNKMREEDTAAGAVAAMDLHDVLDVVKAVEQIRTELGFTAPSWQREVTDPVIRLRNVVMHPVREGGIVRDRGPSLRGLVDLDRRMQQVTGAALLLCEDVG